MFTIDEMKYMEDDEITGKVSAEYFSDIVETEYAKHEGAATYLEVISEIIEIIKLDYGKISKLLTPVLKEKIKKECIDLNLLKDVIKSHDLTKFI